MTCRQSSAPRPGCSRGDQSRCPWVLKRGRAAPARRPRPARSTILTRFMGASGPSIIALRASPAAARGRRTRQRGCPKKHCHDVATPMERRRTGPLNAEPGRPPGATRNRGRDGRERATPTAAARHIRGVLSPAITGALPGIRQHQFWSEGPTPSNPPPMGARRGRTSRRARHEPVAYNRCLRFCGYPA